MYCKRCGTRLQQGMLICPECGARQRHPAGSIRCAHCYGRVSIEMTVCPHCGRGVRPAGPRWGLWIGGLATLSVLGLWGIGRLPVQQVRQEISSSRSRLASLVEFSEPVGFVEPGNGTPTRAPARTAPAGTKPSQAPLPSVVASSISAGGTPRPARTATRTAITRAAAEPGKYYTVESGDTLLGIAESLDIPWQAIAAVNGVDEHSLLQIGQELRIPAPTAKPTVASSSTPATRAVLATPTATSTTAPTASPVSTPTPVPPTPTATTARITAGAMTTYKVQSGDSFAAIGERFGIPWQAIVAANNLTANSMLRPGQELLIPASGAPLPSTPTAVPKSTSTPLPPVPTAAPAATFDAPIVTGPADGNVFNGDRAFVQLTWQAVPELPSNAQYQVTLEWAEKGVPQKYAWITPMTDWKVPPDFWQRATGQYSWTVAAVHGAPDGKGGETFVPLSPPSAPRSFAWN